LNGPVHGGVRRPDDPQPHGFPDLTNADRITDEVLAGKDLWHHNNCVNCHTLMGEGAYYAPDLTQITQQRGRGVPGAVPGDPGRFYSEEVHGG
jgi:nitric oxide reductase subunit C